MATLHAEHAVVDGLLNLQAWLRDADAGDADEVLHVLARRASGDRANVGGRHLGHVHRKRHSAIGGVTKMGPVRATETV